MRSWRTYLPVHGVRFGTVRGVIPSLYDWKEVRQDVTDCRMLAESAATEVAAPFAAGGIADAFFDAITTGGGTGVWDPTASVFRVGHPPWFIASLHDAYVEASQGWVLTQDRHLVLDSLAHVAFLHKHRIEERLRWPGVRRVEGRATVPFVHWARDNYFHWIIEALPRLQPILTDETYRDVRVVVPDPAPSWLLDSLTCLGVDSGRLIHAGKGQLQVEELVFVSRTGKPCFIRDELLEWLVHRLRSAEPRRQAPISARKLYVSRARVPQRAFSRRSIVNEDDLVACLATYDIERVFLEDYSFEEQIALFEQAELIVAPHGAGLANMLFATHATVVELFEPSYVVPLYYVLARQCGHAYWPVTGQSAEGGDISVDVDEVGRIVKETLHGAATYS